MTIGATCEGSSGSHYSDATDCFMQVVTVLFMESISNKNNLVGMKFKNNTASSGDVLFGGLLDRCTIIYMSFQIGSLRNPNQSQNRSFISTNMLLC